MRKNLSRCVCLWALLLIPAPAQSAAIEIASIPPSRIFTPNGDGVNDVIRFRIRSPDTISAVRGGIYDLSGASIAEMKAFSGDTLFWDGKDSNGNLVAKGIYLYRIQAQGSVKTGSVVVAR